MKFGYLMFLISLSGWRRGLLLKASTASSKDWQLVASEKRWRAAPETPKACTADDGSVLTQLLYTAALWLGLSVLHSVTYSCAVGFIEVGSLW